MKWERKTENAISSLCTTSGAHLKYRFYFFNVSQMGITRQNNIFISFFFFFFNLIQGIGLNWISYSQFKMSIIPRGLFYWLQTKIFLQFFFTFYPHSTLVLSTVYGIWDGFTLWYRNTPFKTGDKNILKKRRKFRRKSNGLRYPSRIVPTCFLCINLFLLDSLMLFFSFFFLFFLLYRMIDEKKHIEIVCDSTRRSLFHSLCAYQFSSSMPFKY